MKASDGAVRPAGREGVAAAIGEDKECREDGGLLEDHHFLVILCCRGLSGFVERKNIGVDSGRKNNDHSFAIIILLLFAFVQYYCLSH